MRAKAKPEISRFRRRGKRLLLHVQLGGLLLPFSPCSLTGFQFSPGDGYALYSSGAQRHAHDERERERENERKIQRKGLYLGLASSPCMCPR